jgi:hypothetical protein
MIYAVRGMDRHNLTFVALYLTHEKAHSIKQFSLVLYGTQIPVSFSSIILNSVRDVPVFPDF